MSGFLHLAIRTLHVLGMAVLLGGAGALWLAARAQSEELRRFAIAYEWLFWGAIGVMVVTGIGNLGALGAPGPSTGWGQILLLKLPLVVVLVLGSGVRTLAIVRVSRGVSTTSLAAWSERAYGLTTVTVLALVVIAEVLAHG